MTAPELSAASCHPAEARRNTDANRAAAAPVGPDFDTGVKTHLRAEGLDRPTPSYAATNQPESQPESPAAAERPSQLHALP